jgi:hypothetical protein
MRDLFGHQSAPADRALVEIACELRTETPAAIAIVNGNGELRLSDGRETWVWLPKSRVREIRRENGPAVVVTISDQLAREKGLI